MQEEINNDVIKRADIKVRVKDVITGIVFDKKGGFGDSWDKRDKKHKVGDPEITASQEEYNELAGWSIKWVILQVGLRVVSGLERVHQMKLLNW